MRAVPEGQQLEDAVRGPPVQTEHLGDVLNQDGGQTRTIAGSLGRRQGYRILTISPHPMEARAEIAAGTNGVRSRRRFVGPQKIKMESLRSLRFCCVGMCWSTVTSTSKPAASAASTDGRSSAPPVWRIALSDNRGQ